MNTLWRMLAQYWRGNRVQMLEEEIVRLREENRALVNSILGLAGIPPMRVASGAQISAGVSRVASVGATLPLRQAARGGGPGLGSPGRDMPRPCNDAIASAEANSEVVPLRRRSWQQLGRVREIEDARAARHERESDVETFPAPRNVVPRV